MTETPQTTETLETTLTRVFPPPAPVAEPDIVARVDDDDDEEEVVKSPMQLLVENIVKTQAQLDRNLEFTDPRTRGGHEVAKGAARDRLPLLRAQYTAMLRKGMAAIFLSGHPEGLASFISIAEKEAPLLVVAADALYRRLALEVESSMRTDRSYEPTQCARLQAALMTVCTELGITEMPSPKFKDGAILHKFDDVLAYVRRSVRAVAGDKLNQMYMEKLLTDRAIEIRYQMSVVPVIVTGATKEEVTGLSSFFNNKTVSTITKNLPTTESIIKVFQQLQTKIKKN